MTKSVARLFESFQPESYAIELAVDKEAMTFKGTLKIIGKKVGRPSKRLTFHQNGLTITDAWVTKLDKKGDQKVEINRINHQRSLDEVRLHSDSLFYPGKYWVTIDFTGKVSTGMTGIYLCKFKHDGQDKTLVATQFESHFARKAFPCIDEPEAKATFELALTTEPGQTVLSNTPVRNAIDDEGKVITFFEVTPRMSTYLLAFAYGELGYTEAISKHGVVVRSYATPDNVPHTAFSAEFGAQTLDFFSDYFQTPYPLAKLDMVALPDFEAGAMENWGLVTYREVALLYDQKTAPIESKQYVAMVVAHELSHQWFGDLVTMKWWNDLWLNESFADMMEYRAVDETYPEWHIWEHFVSAEGGSARRRDALADVQSIHTDVHHPDEISTLFDPSIVYAKGGTVLHMLMSYVGEADFQAGLQAYFKKHAYGNTVADDLWDALAAASGKDIAGFMHDWLYRPGYPLVNVSWQPGSDNVELSQRRFFSDPASQTDISEPWQVPIAANRAVEPLLLATETGKAKISDTSEEPLLLNHEGRSYFLPRYANPDHLTAITTAVMNDQVSTIDRGLLLDNYTMLQRGGESSLTDLLALLPAYAHETSDSVWGAIAVAIGEARKLTEGDEASETKLDAMVRDLIMPTVQRLGWGDAPNDDAQTLRLRGLALSLAAGAKEPSVLEAATNLFKKLDKPADVPATVRSVVYFVGVRYGDDQDFAKMLALHRNSLSADERDELVGGLTAAKQPQQYQQLIDLLTGDLVRRQDLMHWFVYLLRNRYSRIATWEWLTSHWDWIEKEFASDKSYGYFMRYCGGVFSHQSELDNYNAFFEPKKSVVALTRDIALGSQEIASRVAWRTRNEADVTDWLAKR
jgi:aminopeptidase N